MNKPRCWCPHTLEEHGTDECTCTCAPIDHAAAAERGMSAIREFFAAKRHERSA